MASKSTHSLLDFSENRPLEAIGKSNSSNSLTGESSSAARVKMNGLFVGGVRGMSGKSRDVCIKSKKSDYFLKQTKVLKKNSTGAAPYAHFFPTR